MSNSVSPSPVPRVMQFADRLDGRFALWAGPLAPAVDACVADCAAREVIDRLYARDTSLWTSDAAVQAKIANRLGWLKAPEWVVPSLPRIARVADGIRRDGFTHVVLLGMGGSSLAPEVIRAVMGVRDGWPTFHMLDSTDPASVAAIDAAVDLPKTLFILASKSGGTIEPNSMAAHFRARLQGVSDGPWAKQFVAITDEGTSLHRRAVADGFREIFVNPGDIGGRYSVLSFFGLVPASLMGHDVAAMVDWARALLWLCGPGRPLGTNSAVLLGAAMAIGAQQGRDKLTLSTPPGLDAFGLWVEQLVAESTGKLGRGVVPVAGEVLGGPAEYGRDRLMVRLDVAGLVDARAREALRTMAAAGTPFAQIELPEPEALAAEFLRWEVATAVAGIVLGVNPFDEPNVQQAKDATGRLLTAFAKDGTVPAHPSASTLAGETAALSASAAAALGNRTAAQFLELLGEGDYLGILAYLGPDPALAAPFEALRRAVRARTRNASTFGYGPRYLHSTGQLHKGGANNGVFLVVSAAPARDVPVPGEGFSFGVLEQAQAFGDFASLDAVGRRALHVHLARPDAGLVAGVCDALLACLK
jgi:glucose-6-phosphate isomerase